MQELSSVINSYSNLLNYPDTELQNVASECVNILKNNNAASINSAELFSEFVKKNSVDELQEYYTRTFEINPTCALEVGWHLFGEQYERGTFIVKMRETLRNLNLPESTELPDHLYHVLQALALLEGEEAKTFANMFILPALTKMLKGLEGKDNMYEKVLEGIQIEIKDNYKQSTQGVNHE